MRLRSHYLLGALFAVVAPGCGSHVAAPGDGRLAVVAVERVYGDLARQLGGDAIDVTTILSSPDADPHEYEPTARDADAVAAADIVVQNGLGYDAFVAKLTSASPRDGRTTIDAGALGGHRDGDNPHVWYDAPTLHLLVNRLAEELERRRPARRAEIDARRDGLQRWVDGFAARVRDLGRRHPHESVAITEPVFDYILRAARIDVATPESFSHAIEEGNDPAPQDVEFVRSLFTRRRVAALVYNDQTVEPSTERLRALAVAWHVNVVAVTETLPADLGTQAWIDGEVAALGRAL